MIALLVLFAVAAGATAGLAAGLHIGTHRTRAALKLARYVEAIALADDLTKNPDALDLRPRAQKLLAAHRAASTQPEEVI